MVPSYDVGTKRLYIRSTPPERMVRSVDAPVVGFAPAVLHPAERVGTVARDGTAVVPPAVAGGAVGGAAAPEPALPSDEHAAASTSVATATSARV